MASLKERLEEAALPSRTVYWIDRDEARKVLALLAAADGAIIALDTAQAEGGGTGYYASKANELRAAIAAMEES